MYAETVGVATLADKLIVYNVFVLQILLAVKGFILSLSGKKNATVRVDSPSGAKRRFRGKGSFVDASI